MPKRAGLAATIVALAMVLNPALASADTAAPAPQSPITFVESMLSGFAAGIEHFAAAAGNEIGGLVATLTNSAAPATENYGAFAAAVDASQAPPTIPAQQSSSTDPFGPPAQTATTTATTTTVVAQVVVEKEQPIVEDVTQAGQTVTPAELQGVLTGLSEVLNLLPATTNPSPDVESQIAALQSAISSQGYSADASVPLGGGSSNTIAAANAIDQLSGTAITNPSITGGSIAGASLSGGSVSANSLAVSGDTSLSGDLNVGGNFTAGSISFSAASSTGSITTNSTTTNLIATNATSTTLFASIGHFTSGLIDTLTSAVANFGTITATNSFATNSTTTNLAVTGTLNAGNASTTWLSATNFSSTNATSTNLYAASAVIPTLTGNASTFAAATSTDFFATTASSTNLFAQTAWLGSLTANSLSLSAPLSVGSGGSGSTTLSGILKGNGAGGILSAVAGTDYLAPGSLSATYPMLYSGNNFSLAFGTTTANTWSQLQTLGGGFIANSSSTVAGNFNATGNEYFGGSVGIGTTNPSYKLDVNGDANVSAGSAYRYNGQPVITASTTLNNYFFGDAGNLTMTGVNNVASGYGTLVNNTTGFYNTANGHEALYSNTIGDQNTANGEGTLFSNTTGNYNTANGQATLYFNTTGTFNAGDGINALQHNTTGIGNTANGASAGLTLLSGNYNTFLGFNADVSAAASTTLTNSTALGYGAQVTASNQVVLGNSSVTQTLLNGNVGIGTDDPLGQLTLLRAGGSSIYFSDSNNTDAIKSVQVGLGSELSFSTNGASNEVMRLTQGGNVGIGTTNPTANLEVSGPNINTPESFLITAGAATSYEDLLIGTNQTSGSLTATDKPSIFTTAYDGTSYPFTNYGALVIRGRNDPTNGGIDFQTGSGSGYNNSMVILPSSNVGIGTTVPGQKLDVAGNINVSAGSAYMYNGANVITASTTLYDYFFGDAGNLTMTGGNNTGNGAGALFSNTTGSNNTVSGMHALQLNTTGTQNTANGFYSLYNNTTAFDNSAYGDNSLKNTTTGGNNTAGGESSLYSNTTGTGNTALGYAAGYNASPLLQTMSNSTFLGYGANSSVDGVTNSTAIGNGAQVTQSNQMVFGNSSVTQTLLNGNVGIGLVPGSTPVSGVGNLSILGTSVAGLDMVRYGSTWGTGIRFQAAWGTASAPATTTAGQYLGTLEFMPYTGSTFGSAAKIYATAAVTASSTDTSGNLGFSTTGPGQTTETERMRITSTGNIGIGTPNPYSLLEVWGPDTASTSVFAVVNSASTTEFTVYDTGNATLAGSLVQNSDARLKTNINDLDGSSSLAEIDALSPVTFNWVDPAKSSVPQFGFIAQQVQSVFPNLVSTTSPTALTPDGTLSLNYIDLISPLVAAIQQLDKEITSLASTIANFAESFTSKQITATNELCIGQTCIDETQLRAILAAASQSASAFASPSPSTSDATNTPPIIAINGDNPAIVQIGTTYSDLGATITGPQADLNLDIKTFLNGALVSNIVLDTSAAATDTIDYVAADQNGLSATSTRTVIVQAANDNQASTTPANDNAAATTTVATSTAQ